MAASVVPWRLAVDPLEGRAEGERVRVADLGGDRSEGVVGADEQVSRKGQPPARQVGERRFAHLRGEAPREGSARQPDTRRQRLDGPRAFGLLLDGAERASDQVVPRGSGRRREHGPHAAHDQQVEQPIDDGDLPGSVTDDLLREQADQCRLEVPNHQFDRQLRQQQGADRGLLLVGADQHDRRVIRARVAPGSEVEFHVRGKEPTIRIDADLAGEDADVLGCLGTVGEGVRRRAADHHDVTRTHLCRTVMAGERRPTTRHHHDSQRRTVLDRDRPRAVEHRLERKRALGTGPVDKSTHSIHAVDARTCY